MKNKGKMKRFIRIVRDIVDDEDFDASRPRTMFLRAFILFKRAEGISGKFFSEREHQEMRELFVRTLRKEGIKIKRGVLDTGVPIRKKSKIISSIVTQAMLRGAREAQLRHDGVLKYNT